MMIKGTFKDRKNEMDKSGFWKQKNTKKLELKTERNNM